MTTSTISAKDAAAWLSAGDATLIDVRSPEEFSAEHIGAALSVPLPLLPAALDQLALPQGRKLVVQCQKGARGSTACALIGQSRAGVYNLEGGIDAWKAAGLPVVAVGKAPVISIFRQVQIVIGSLIALMILAGFAIAPGFFVAAGAVAAMLAIAGVTGWCGMALLLQRMPWNRA